MSLRPVPHSRANDSASKEQEDEKGNARRPKVPPGCLASQPCPRTHRCISFAHQPCVWLVARRALNECFSRT